MADDDFDFEFDEDMPMPEPSCGARPAAPEGFGEDDDALARRARRTRRAVRRPERSAPTRAARVAFVLPQIDAAGQLYVVGEDGHRLDLNGPEALDHIAALAHAYVAIRSIFSDRDRAEIDRIADENGY